MYSTYKLQRYWHKIQALLKFLAMIQVLFYSDVVEEENKTNVT